MLDNTVVPLRTAAEVSSHDDSMAKIYSFISIKRKDKDTKNSIIHSILIVIAIIFALFASIYVVILDVNVQSMLARTVAGVLSDKYEAEVKIKTFYIKPNFRIYAEEVQFNDKKHNPMFYVGKVNARLSVRDISKEYRLRKLDIEDLLVNIVKYEDDYQTNVAEMFATAEKKEKNKEGFKIIYLDELSLKDGHVVVWNQNKDKPEKTSMDYAHLDIDSVNLFVRSLSFDGHAVKGYINKLECMDKCGFDIDKFSSNSLFTVSSQGFDFKNLNVETHATSLNLDLQFLYKDYRSFRSFVDSVMIIANIRPSQLTLSDLRYFSPTMGKMTDTLQISGLITGFVRDFTANNFKFSFKDSTSFEGRVKMKGLPNFHETHIVGDVEKMNFTYQDISEFAIPSPTGKIPLPERLSSLKNAMLSGEFYGFHNNFNTTFNLHTNLGNIYLNGALNNDLNIVPLPYYFLKIHANNLNAKELIGVDQEFTVTMSSDLHGEGLTKQDANLEVVLNVDKLKLMGNVYNDFSITGDFENQRLIASTDVKSKLIKLDLDGLLDVSSNIPSFDVKMNIEDADLYKLNILNYDKKSKLSTDIRANLRGVDVDGMYGTISLDNTLYRDSRGEYRMDSLDVVLTENYFDSKDVSVKSDFFDIDLRGIVNFTTIANSFKNYVMNHFHVDKWSDKGVKLKDNTQDFYVNMMFKNTETLSRLLMPQLRISDNTNLTATYTSNKYQLYTTIESDMITYNNLIFDNIYLKNKTDVNKTTADIRIEEFVIKEETESNPVRLSMENMALLVDAHNDSLLFNVKWNDEDEERNKGVIDASYVVNKDAGRLCISASDVVVNDSVWSLSPTCYLDFKKNKIFINEFDVYSGNQSMSVSGYFPKTSLDTLYLNFNKLDISNFDLLTVNKGIDVDGVIDGNVKLSGLQEKFTLFSNLDITDIGLNSHIIGNAFVDANWSAPDTSIFVNAEIVRSNSDDRIMSFVGKYYTSRNDNLDFDINLKEIDISVVNAFTKGVLSRVSGNLNGNLELIGSLKNPIIVGDAELNDAACHIDYLNTYYAVNKSGYEENTPNRFIKFTENRIDLNDIVLIDTLDNIAVARGVITHDYLKNFTFDVDATLDNFMGMNMLGDDKSSFYGTVIASGDLNINGPLDDIVMNINAYTMPGTKIDIRLTSASSINDNFIIFVGENVDNDTVISVVEDKKKDKKFTLNLNADVTNVANVNIHLPSNMGNITANGSGNIRLGLLSNQLSLYGDYVIDGGAFNFNLQNLVRRNFDIKKGGTITWTGRADDADINVIGSYRTKSSISSLGLELDSTSVVNNVNVDCILHLNEKLTNPTITFGLSLPNATDDIKNTVFSVIDTTNQAVMSQQIISLLVLGSFSYSNTGLYSIGVSNYYNVLTSSLSSWLSQISKDFDIGVRYTPEDNLTAEELEVALSTQLFDDRLTIEGNLGMYSASRNDVATGANNIVGDVDISLKLTNRLSLKAYNHSNLSSNYYSYSYEAYSDYTQGIGISYSQSFDNIKEIFARKNRNKKNKDGR